MTVPAAAEVVIVGGGAVGCAVAYSLAKAGITDVVLIEREPALAAVTTAQAAGLVGQVRSSVERVKLAMWSVATFSELARDTEVNPGWRQVGSLRVALTDQRVEEFQRLTAVASEAGLEVEWVDPAHAQRQWPAMRFDRAKAILWCPTDGYLQPSDLTMAYSRHAREHGARFLTGTEVEQVVVRNGQVAAVVTDRGKIECRALINAAGAHAYHVAQMVGIELPIVPVRHEYFVTVHGEGIKPDYPCVRVPDATLYLRAEINGLLAGGWEPQALSADPRSFASRQPAPGIKEDWEVLAWFGQQLAPHFPQVNELGIRGVFKGWPTFTPDGRFIVGPSKQVEGFVMAGGCNAHGVSGSAGMGRHVVESMLEPNPSEYVRSLSPDRFTETDWDWASARQQAQQVYETYYALEL